LDLFLGVGLSIFLPFNLDINNDCLTHSFLLSSHHHLATSFCYELCGTLQTGWTTISEASSRFIYLHDQYCA
jgi:hypothetical protein